jgi:hypothetical protein
MSQSAPAPLQHEHLIGTWHLRTCELRSTDGQVMYPYSTAPVGMLMYDPTGFMVVLLMRPGRPTFVSGDVLRGTPDEIKAAFEGFDAYCGTYTVDAHQHAVTHHLIATRFPNWEGTDQLRFVDLTENELILRSPPIRAGGNEWTVVVTWTRAQV